LGIIVHAGIENIDLGIDGNTSGSVILENHWSVYGFVGIAVQN
jgi:hypothetical protein